MLRVWGYATWGLGSGTMLAPWVPCRVKVGPRMRLEGRERCMDVKVLLKYTKKFLQVP
jgi:hypothetical protein